MEESNISIEAAERHPQGHPRTWTSVDARGSSSCVESMTLTEALLTRTAVAGACARAPLRDTRRICRTADLDAG